MRARCGSYSIVLDDFCNYCVNFVPTAEKENVSEPGEKMIKMKTKITCKNKKKCMRIFELLEKKIEKESKNE